MQCCQRAGLQGWDSGQSTLASGQEATLELHQLLFSQRSDLNLTVQENPVLPQLSARTCAWALFMSLQFVGELKAGLLRAQMLDGIITCLAGPRCALLRPGGDVGEHATGRGQQGSGRVRAGLRSLPRPPLSLRGL